MEAVKGRGPAPRPPPQHCPPSAGGLPPSLLPLPGSHLDFREGPFLSSPRCLPHPTSPEWRALPLGPSGHLPDVIAIHVLLRAPMDDPVGQLLSTAATQHHSWQEEKCRAAVCPPGSPTHVQSHAPISTDCTDTPSPALPKPGVLHTSRLDCCWTGPWQRCTLWGAGAAELPSLSCPHHCRRPQCSCAHLPQSSGNGRTTLLGTRRTAARTHLRC